VPYEAEAPVICQNCGSADRVADLSFDIDLPTVRLCGMCSLTITLNRELFDEMGERYRRRTRRRKP
jgi:hypothetical protein